MGRGVGRMSMGMISCVEMCRPTLHPSKRKMSSLHPQCHHSLCSNNVWSNSGRSETHMKLQTRGEGVFLHNQLWTPFLTGHSHDRTRCAVDSAMVDDAQTLVRIVYLQVTFHNNISSVYRPGTLGLIYPVT